MGEARRVRPVRISPAVFDDLAEAADWYGKEGGSALSDRFVTNFRHYLTKIQATGEMRRIVHSDFRKLILRPFPYMLFYRLEEETWVVVALVHSARSPERISKLLGER